MNLEINTMLELEAYEKTKPKAETMKNEWQCPKCGAENAVYPIGETRDEIDWNFGDVGYDAACEECGWEGEVWFKINYLEHYTDPTRRY